FASVYDVTDAGNFEGHTILNRLHLLDKPDENTEARLAAMRRLLFMVRDARVHPGWDDKVLADWNGLMIAALANAALAFGEPEWLAMAEHAFTAVVRDLGRVGNDETARISHSYRAAK